jgi:L-threonylcarbamoyladenylate synthase
MAEEYVKIEKDVYENLIKKYWPGGLTIILKCKIDKVPDTVRAGGNTLAVRFPNHPVLQSIISSIGVPIVAPSANFSGAPTPARLDQVDIVLKDKVDFILPGMCTMEGVSTIIDCTKTPWKVLRKGVVDLNQYDKFDN